MPTIPKELVIQVFSFLDAKALVNLGLANKKLLYEPIIAAPQLDTLLWKHHADSKYIKEKQKIELIAIQTQKEHKLELLKYMYEQRMSANTIQQLNNRQVYSRLCYTFPYENAPEPEADGMMFTAVCNMIFTITTDRNILFYFYNRLFNLNIQLPPCRPSN